MKQILRLIIPIIFLSSTAFAQTLITGVIKGSDGAPIPSATVLIRGTSVNTVADINGKFSIAAQQKLPFTLLFNYGGYKSQEVEIYELPDAPLDIVLVEDFLNEVVVTSRRRQEVAQNVPIPISVIGGAFIEQSGAFNVNRLKEFIPSLQLYTSNPRNTGINIRGIGSPFGLTNDGLDPGVGFYVDGVYYARPAAATLDFIDIERVEVLRGPQGTLFGKNTTAGAINITTRKPSFTPGANFELSYGNYGYIQAKTSITGPITKKLAGRISFSGTQRDGLIKNIATGQRVNDINNIGTRGQLLFTPTNDIDITLSGDYTQQRPNGYAQVVAGVAPTLRAPERQFNRIISDLGYQLPTDNAFDRFIDHDTPWRSGNDLGGVSLNADFKIGPGTLTSTTAWRYWNWDPSNDRDFTGLQALRLSQNPAVHKNWSQEIRYSGQISSKLSGVVGLFFIDQEVKINGTEESGNAQWRFSQTGFSASQTASWRTPGLLEGFGIKTTASIKSKSAAAFANIDWEIIDGLHILPGIRFNYDEKDVSYDRVAYGGLQTTVPALVAIKNGIYTSQFYEAGADENNTTYQVTLSYKASKRINAYATYSTSYKPVGVNVAGLPTPPAGGQLTDLAVIKPEYVKHVEAGLKTTPINNFTLNVTYHNTDIEDYQTNVQSPELSVNRGYIANAEKVNVNGVELDGNIKVNKYFSFYGSAVYTDAKYVTFTNAPRPLEETGYTEGGVQVAFKDVSGSRLPGVSKWATSIGGEFTTSANFLRQSGLFFFAVDTYYRSEFSSSASPSIYLNIDGYVLANARAGFRVTNGLSASLWARNLFNKNYYEQLLVAGGNAGQYGAVLGDQRTYGVTLKYSF